MDLCMSVAAQLMLQEIEKGSKNVVLSPMSITIVLNMLASGSNGETLDQFLHFLCAKDVEELTANAKAMMSFITSAAEEDNPRPAAPPSDPLGQWQPYYAAEGVSTANADRGYPLKPRFVGGSAKEDAALPSVPHLLGKRRWLDRERRFIEEPVFSVANRPPWVDHRYPMNKPRFPEMPFHASAASPSVPRLVGHSQTWPFPAEREQGLREGPVFSMANALWIDHGYPLKPRFAEIADTVYKTLVKNVDLVTEAEKVRKEVNSWAEKQTKGLIKEVLSSDIKLSPPLCLANALYFEANWQSPFSVSDTLHGRDFYLLNGETAKVSYMTTQNKHHIFRSFKDFKILELPYKREQYSAEGKRFSMYIFLPHARDGLRDLVAKLDADPAALHPKNFPLGIEPLSHVLMPKVKFTFDFEAQDLMAAKKLTLPFDPDHADFSDMVKSPQNIFVGKIIHKAFIEVAEKGTKAAAVTVACMICSCAPGMFERPKHCFVADHPFMFMIVEDSSKLVVFAGAVLNPALE